MMPNKNYVKGYKIELMAKKELEDSGHFVVRSSGSHGIIDLIAIDFNYVRLIQIKSCSTPRMPSFKDEISKLSDFREKMPGFCRVELWVKGNKEWKKITI